MSQKPTSPPRVTSLSRYCTWCTVLVRMQQTHAYCTHSSSCGGRKVKSRWYLALTLNLTVLSAVSNRAPSTLKWTGRSYGFLMMFNCTRSVFVIVPGAVVAMCADRGRRQRLCGVSADRTTNESTSNARDLHALSVSYSTHGKRSELLCYLVVRYLPLRSNYAPSKHRRTFIHLAECRRASTVVNEADIPLAVGMATA